MSIKPAAMTSPRASTASSPTRRRSRPGSGGRAGASRRRSPRTARERDTWVRRDGLGEPVVSRVEDHEIDPAFDEFGELDRQVDHLFSHRRRAAAWDRSAEDDWRDFA